MEQTPLECCPHCQSDMGYYKKVQIRGTCEERYKFDGTRLEEENSDMHDGLFYTFSKWVYCRTCKKRIFKNNSA